MWFISSLRGNRESVGPHHISREDANWPVGLHPDGYVSFLARGQNVSMFVYDLKEEEDWMDDSLKRSYSHSGVTAELARGDHFVLNSNQKSRGAQIPGTPAWVCASQASQYTGSEEPRQVPLALRTQEKTPIILERLLTCRPRD